MKYLLGCPCNHKIEVDDTETRTEIRCSHCHRYIKVPPLQQPAFLNLPITAVNPKAMLGKILAKRFVLRHYLGGGGMGWVYQADDLKTHREVAVKILKPSHVSAKNNLALQRFYQEARIASQLIHTGIVVVRSLHRCPQGTCFMVMDFCRGESLRALLGRKKFLPVAQAVTIAVKILEALQVAHARQVIHRDIKPSNIMVDETPQGIAVKVLDFGIAKCLDQEHGPQLPITKVGYRLGSLKYMSPEQMVGQPAGIASDIYGVGVVLYQMIAGVLPWEGSREPAVHPAVAAEPISLRHACQANQIPCRIPWWLEAAVLKALSPKPECRFTHAR